MLLYYAYIYLMIHSNRGYGLNKFALALDIKHVEGPPMVKHAAGKPLQDEYGHRGMPIACLARPAKSIKKTAKKRVARPAETSSEDQISDRPTGKCDIQPSSLDTYTSPR